jgi:hypothetical protein
LGRDQARGFCVFKEIPMAEVKVRKTRDEVKNELAVAKEARRVRAEKAAAYQVKYQADALARREKLAAEAAAPAAPKAEAA